MKTKSKIVNADMVLTPEWFRSFPACSDGYKWVCDIIGQGMTLEELLPKFDRSDWMLWTLKRTGSLADKMTSVRIAIKCAEAVVGIYEKKYPKDDGPRKAIEASLAYVKDPSEKNRIDAAAAGVAAYAAANAAAYAAANAADAAAYARKSMHKKLCAMIILELTETGSTEKKA